MSEFGFDEQVEASLTLRGVLQTVGVTTAEIDRAESDGTLELLAVERLVLPDLVQYDLRQLADSSSLSVDQVGQLWRALGFPDPRPGEKIFSDSDVEMMNTVAGLLELGVADPDLVVQMARVIGSSLARVASAQIDSFDLASPEDRASVNDTFALQAGALLPTMPKVMDYVWRHHLKAAAERRMVRLTDAAEGAEDVLAVGFADMVGFTALAQQVSAHELAAVVDRFETVAYETVARLGGRVVKMIGDEVMFTVQDSRQAIEIGLTLAAAYHDDDALSEVRVGIASGPVLQREADCYGPVVNLASRIVGIAFPGTVVTADEVHEGLDEDPTLAWRSLRFRTLKDIGKVRLWSVRRADDHEEDPGKRDRVRSRRTERREQALEELAETERAEKQRKSKGKDREKDRDKGREKGRDKGRAKANRD